MQSLVVVQCPVPGSEELDDNVSEPSVVVERFLGHDIGSVTCVVDIVDNGREVWCLSRLQEKKKITRSINNYLD